MSRAQDGVSAAEHSNKLAAMRLCWYTDQDASKHLQQSAGIIPDLPVSIFTSLDWYRSAAEHLLFERRLYVLAVEFQSMTHTAMAFTYGREKLAGLAPARTLRILGFPMGDRHPLTEGSNDTIQSVLQDGLDSFPEPVDAIIFDEVLHRDTEMLRQIAANLGYFVSVRQSARSPVKSLEGIADCDALLKGYSKSLRTRIKRAMNKLDKTGNYRICITKPTPDTIDECLTVAIELESRSWKGQEGVGIFDPATRPFFVALSRRLAERGALLFTTLLLEEQPIAYRYSFVEQDIVYDYNFAHLEQYAALSPGRILLDANLREGVESGCHWVDASRGSLKRPHLLADWTDEVLFHERVLLFPKTANGSILFGLSDYVRPWVRRFAAGRKDVDQT